MEPLIHFKGADILNGESVVIYGLDMDVMPGDLVYIVGKVGSGKTSIIRTVTAENRLLSGEGEACGYNLRGIKSKDMIGIPWMLAFALRADGWFLRSDIIGEMS